MPQRGTDLEKRGMAHVTPRPLFASSRPSICHSMHHELRRCNCRLHASRAVVVLRTSGNAYRWYPILEPGFTEEYFRVLSGPLQPSTESCLMLLVAAIGSLTGQDKHTNSLHQRPDLPFFEAAMVSLPLVMAECNMTSMRCLLLSVYYCCILKSCQAHDYSLIVSFKFQNYLRARSHASEALAEGEKRLFWAALLLENELVTQFDVAESGIWAFDEMISLPKMNGTWHFDSNVVSPQAPVSPLSAVTDSSISLVKVQSYYLAEVAMRRMLHRCNTAVTHQASGQIAYAPAIAQELESQLQEWYSYLPPAIRFDVALENDPSSPATLQRCPLTTFLRVQYYCCKIAIYWPAVYQVMETGEAQELLLGHCGRLFDSYRHFMPCIIVAFETCVVNRWTLFLSIFMKTMAAMKAASTPALQAICPPDIDQCFSAAMGVDRNIINESPPLRVLYETLDQQLTGRYAQP